MVSQSKLRFLGTDRWYRESEDGRLRICKVMIWKIPRYEVWEKNSIGEWHPKRMNLPSYEDALKQVGAFDAPELFGAPGMTAEYSHVLTDAQKTELLHWYANGGRNITEKAAEMGVYARTVSRHIENWLSGTAQNRGDVDGTCT